MYPQLPDIAGLGDRTLCLDFFGLFVNIEVILYGFLGIEGVQELIGLGGIDSGEKALEYLYAGANAVEVGAAALFDPVAPLRVARELDDLLDSRPELAAKLAAGQTWR